MEERREGQACPCGASPSMLHLQKVTMPGPKQDEDRPLRIAEFRPRITSEMRRSKVTRNGVVIALGAIPLATFFPLYEVFLVHTDWVVFGVAVLVLFMAGYYLTSVVEESFERDLKDEERRRHGNR